MQPAEKAALRQSLMKLYREDKSSTEKQIISAMIEVMNFETGKINNLASLHQQPQRRVHPMVVMAELTRRQDGDERRIDFCEVEAEILAELNPYREYTEKLREHLWGNLPPRAPPLEQLDRPIPLTMEWLLHGGGRKPPLVAGTCSDDELSRNGGAPAPSQYRTVRTEQPSGRRQLPEELLPAAETPRRTPAARPTSDAVLDAAGPPSMRAKILSSAGPTLSELQPAVASTAVQRPSTPSPSGHLIRRPHKCVTAALRAEPPSVPPPIAVPKPPPPTSSAMIPPRRSADDILRRYLYPHFVDPGVIQMIMDFLGEDSSDSISIEEATAMYRFTARQKIYRIMCTVWAENAFALDLVPKPLQRRIEEGIDTESLFDEGEITKLEQALARQFAMLNVPVPDCSDVEDLRFSLTQPAPPPVSPPSPTAASVVTVSIPPTFAPSTLAASKQGADATSPPQTAARDVSRPQRQDHVQCQKAEATAPAAAPPRPDEHGMDDWLPEYVIVQESAKRRKQKEVQQQESLERAQKAHQQKAEAERRRQAEEARRQRQEEELLWQEEVRLKQEQRLREEKRRVEAKRKKDQEQRPAERHSYPPPTPPPVKQPPPPVKQPPQLAKRLHPTPAKVKAQPAKVVEPLEVELQQEEEQAPSVFTLADIAASCAWGSQGDAEEAAFVWYEAKSRHLAFIRGILTGLGISDNILGEKCIACQEASVTSKGTKRPTTDSPALLCSQCRLWALAAQEMVEQTAEELRVDYLEAFLVDRSLFNRLRKKGVGGGQDAVNEPPEHLWIWLFANNFHYPNSTDICIVEICIMVHNKYLYERLLPLYASRIDEQRMYLLNALVDLSSKSPLEKTGIFCSKKACCCRRVLEYYHHHGFKNADFDGEWSY